VLIAAVNTPGTLADTGIFSSQMYTYLSKGPVQMEASRPH